ncbi:MAG: hypothetical protein KDB27_11520 [Planctomycetales bacterium]|nr:hypothetical protein [Planctomycetales bacterium]
MPNSKDVKVVDAELYFLPVHTRMPLKFGAETVKYVTCARCKITVEGQAGKSAVGWGETPLSVTWVWPSSLAYEERHESLKAFCRTLTREWPKFDVSGHPIEIGRDFIVDELARLQSAHNESHAASEPMPWLASLVCFSLFDIATHDAYGNLHDCDIYSTYNRDWMNRSLEHFLEPALNSNHDFRDQYPCDFLTSSPPHHLPAWHLVGGTDPISPEELTGNEPEDEYPVLLEDWIRTDKLNCLKVKLRGNDATWDYDRLVKTGQLAINNDVDWLTTDFNCMVTNPDYVNEMLDRLCLEHPRIYGMILYVEQPFPHDLDANRIDVHSVSARKPLFLDESAHDWQHIRLGRQLGWTGVALKTCKTQTGAILSACWAKAHGMTLMVQDLTNPMLAQIPHVRLAAHVGTIMGVETNAMQFYPAVSKPESAIHPGLYQRRNGQIDLSTISGSGFGYRVGEISRELPDAES